MVALKTNGVSHTNGVTVPLVNGHASSYAAKHNLSAHFIGGNHLAAAASGRVKDFVASHDGHTVITSVCNLELKCPKNLQFADAENRFLLLTTESQPSRR